MPTLKLSFGESVLREIGIGADPITIGRSPQSDLYIDNPAVSFQHARVFSYAGAYYIQDLGSLNGTFLNGARITQAPLSYGDVITVGKHSVRFSRDQVGVRPQVPAAQGELENDALKLTGTMVLDTKMRREIQERLAKSQANPPSARATRLGKLSVLKGKTSAKEFLLTAHTTIIGKSKECSIRLKGWFAPKLGAMIVKQADTYHVSPSCNKVTVNGLALTAKVQLKEGDVLGVGALQLQFTLVDW